MADFCLVSNDKIGTRKIINSTQYLRNDVDIEVQPWYLRPNYERSDILFDTDGNVTAGSKSALIERLTAHETAGACSRSSMDVFAHLPVRLFIQQILYDDLQIIHDGR